MPKNNLQNLKFQLAAMLVNVIDRRTVGGCTGYPPPPNHHVDSHPPLFPKAVHLPHSKPSKLENLKIKLKIINVILFPQSDDLK